MTRLTAFVLAALVAAPVLAQEPAPKSEPAGTATKPALQTARRMGEATPLVIEKDREVYGAELQLKETTKLSDILKDPKTYVGRKIRVTGTIDDVCQKRGCWMNVKDGDARTMVKFNEYGFFVPLDVAGRTVTVEGTAKETPVTEAMRRHYAQDAGKSKEEIEKIKGSETSVMLIVDAVEIGGPAKTEAKADTKAAESKPVEKAKEPAKAGGPREDF